ncbi:hypothetical protein DVA81_19775, partial [Acinetobacter baumannii]
GDFNIHIDDTDFKSVTELLKKVKVLHVLILGSCVLLLGPHTTRYSTVWPVMDPAHSPSLQSRFERIEGILQQHEAMMA